MTDHASLRALIQDRKTKQKRLLYKHAFSLSPEMYTDRQMLIDELEDLPEPAETPEGGQKPRLNGDPRTRLERQLRELEEKIAEHTVLGVFKALSADGIAAKVAEWDQAEMPTLGKARALILECFEYFEDHGEPIPAADLGKPDLADLLPALTQGETYGLSNTLTDMTSGDIDIPKSVRQSLAARKSDATSKPASS